MANYIWVVGISARRQKCSPESEDTWRGGPAESWPAAHPHPPLHVTEQMAASEKETNTMSWEMACWREQSLKDPRKRKSSICYLKLCIDGFIVQNGEGKLKINFSYMASIVGLNREKHYSTIGKPIISNIFGWPNNAMAVFILHMHECNYRYLTKEPWDYTPESTQSNKQQTPVP